MTAGGVSLGSGGALFAATTSGFYEKRAFLDPWTTITTSHAFSTLCLWNPAVDYTVLAYAREKAPVMFFGRGTISSQVYTPDEAAPYSAEALDSGYNSKFGSYFHCACGHQGRVLVSVLNTIWYSNQYAEEFDGKSGILSGYDENYVIVPESDEITGMYNLNGNLYVLFFGSIWVKMGEESDMIEENFRPVIQGSGAYRHVHCIGDNRIFFGNAHGCYILQGSGAVEISEPIRRHWQKSWDKATAFMTFWPHRKWLFVKPSSTLGILIYDLTCNKWYSIDHFTLLEACAAGSSSGQRWFFMNKYGSDGATHALEFSDVGDDTVSQSLATKFTPLSHYHNTKRASRLFLNGSGITKAEIRTRQDLEAGESGTLIKSITNPQRIEVLDLQAFQELSVKQYGTGAAIIRPPAIEFIEQRV